MVESDKAKMPRIPGYTTEAILGVGGMATVYLAVQESLSRHVALKVMNPLLMVDSDYCRRFLNEGRLIARLSHPNIVTVYDIGASELFHYLSMTYLPGGTLKEKIRGGVDLESTLAIFKRLAEALGYAHRQGIVHRDIKPGNVLFTDSNEPILTDFGIAKTVGNETKLTSTGVTVGSVGYMSPEQALGQEVDCRSDLYSLGVLLWQMLTGALPYSAPDPFALALKHAKDPIPKLPRPLDRFQPVIEGLMAKKPEDRLASAEELLRLVHSIRCDDLAPHPSPEPDGTVVLASPKSAPAKRRNVASQPETARPAARTVKSGRAAGLVGTAALMAIAGYFGYVTFLAPGDGSPAGSRWGPTALPGPEESGPPSSAESPVASVHGSQGARSDEAASPPEVDVRPDDVSDRLTGSQESSVDELLRRAQAQLAAGRLTEPAGDNAFETYSRVLNRDPEHPEAKEGLVRIGRINAANKLFLSAESLVRGGEIRDARRMIETGLKMNPKDERLLGLQRALDYAR
jgi:serine/threonine protein kinase